VIVIVDVVVVVGDVSGDVDELVCRSRCDINGEFMQDPARVQS
jgi:hypothetical protein